MGTDHNELEILFLGQAANFLERDADHDTAGQFEGGNILPAAFGFAFQFRQGLGGTAALHFVRFAAQGGEGFRLAGVIWWPGRANWRSALAIDARRNWRRITWELHRAAGFWAVGFIAMWAVTGLSFAFSREFRQAVNWLSPITVVRAPLSDPARRTTDAPSWRSMIERAHTQKPGQFAARIVTPSNETAAFLVMFSAVQPTPADGAELESVYLDRFTGDVLLTAPGPLTVGDVFMAWVAPLHIGNFGSLGIRVVWAVIGLVPPMLFATGFFMWWTRVVRHR
jgi:uncharacterized iron-regulated membrane protein